MCAHAFPNKKRGESAGISPLIGGSSPALGSKQAKQKKGEFWVKHCIQSRKPVATVSAKISLHFSETSITNAILPYSLTTTIRTLNFTFSCHPPFLHILVQAIFPKQKKGRCGGSLH
jgi:hypothetical protein